MFSINGPALRNLILFMRPRFGAAYTLCKPEENDAL